MYNGMINIYKEKGFTSHDVVAKLRGILKQKKIGHTGTLDPDAEGVLPVCLGSGTKLCDMLTEKDKIYETVLLLGKSTDTQDISGKVTAECENLEEMRVICNPEKIRETILSFVGKSAQIPPMYSALKVNGKKLYELAREGIEVERKAREIEIFSIDILDIAFPRVRMRVHCSKGTYIRTLCHDIGEKLGTHGCMETLLRTKVGIFELEGAKKLSEVEQAVKEERILSLIVPVDELFSEYPAVYMKPETDKILLNGNPLPQNLVKPDILAKDGELIRMYDSRQHFCAVYCCEERKKRFKVYKMF